MNPVLLFKKEILKTWEKRVKESIPVAREQSHFALKNSLPDYLDNIAKLMDKDEEVKELANVKEDLIGKVHGQHRANANYRIDQMIDEYFILKEVIVSVLKRENAYGPKIAEVISDSIEHAIQVSAAQFSKSLLETQENFVMALAHDLRNPLMVIKMNSDMIKRRLGEKETSLLEKLDNSVIKIDKMIEDLLDAMRNQSHGMNFLDFSECDLCQIISEVISVQAETFKSEIKFEGSSVIGTWNPRAMERVMDNLISNAIKYGDSSKPISVRLQSDSNLVHLSVHNFGVPIPPQDLKNIFQKFKRSEQSYYKKGWGIGLSLVKSVVEAHQGSILVNSDDSGTIFKIELPVHRMVKAEAQVEQ